MAGPQHFKARIARMFRMHALHFECKAEKLQNVVNVLAELFKSNTAMANFFVVASVHTFTARCNDRANCHGVMKDMRSKHELASRNGHNLQELAVLTLMQKAS